MLHQKNTTHLTIVNTGKGMVAAGTLVNDYTDFTNDGDIAILDVDNKSHTHASSGTKDKFRIAQRYGNKILYSPFITTANIKSFRGTPAVAAKEQIDFIGYNGTSGSIEVIDENVYKVNIDVKYAYGTNPYGQLLKHGVYKSGVNATQEQIAAGLTQNLIDNFSRDKYISKEEGIKFERVNAGTSTATSGGTLSVANGSKTVVIEESASGAADAGKYDSDSKTMAIGDYLRIGHATTSTYGVYKIANIAGAGTATCTVTLDIPFQGDTNSALAAANAGVIPAASVGAFGIKLEGRKRPNFTPGVWKYYKIRWNATLSEDFGATPLTLHQTANEGTGQYEQIAEDEWFYQGNEGSHYRVQVPNIPSRAIAASGAIYYQITIEDYDTTSSTIVGETKLPKKTVLAIAVSSIVDQTARANFEIALETITGLTMV